VKRYVRKIQFTGRSSYIVSLPKNWVLARGLKERDQVVIEERGDFIIIKPFRALETSEQSERVAVIETSTGNPDSLARRVIATYIMGYDKIVLKGYIDPAVRNTVREVALRRLPGVEVTNESDREIVLQVLLDHRSISLSNAIERLIKLTSSVLRDVCSALSRINVALANEIIREDDSIDRIYFYAVRLINYMAMGRCELAGNIEPVDLITYRSLGKLVERIGDHAINIAKNILELGEVRPELKEASEICTYVHGIFEKAINAFLSRNPVAVDDIAVEVEVLKARERSLLERALKTLSTRELIALRLILESIRRVAEYSRDVAELALDLGISSLLVESK
jgi:phosphate uptake regulator